MNVQKVKELGREIRSTIPDNTHSLKIKADQTVEIKFKDSDGKLTTIKTQLKKPDNYTSVEL